MTADDEVMSQVRAMCAHLAQPYWFRQPEAWRWSTSEGLPQTLHVPHSPGLTNLLWLSLDMNKPPGEYELQKNALALMLLAWGPATYFDGVSLLDAAGIMPMAKFYDRLRSEPIKGNPLQNLYPLILALLKGRLHA